MMIRELFFPRTVGSKLLFAERTVGIAIEGHQLFVSHIHASRHKRKIARLETYTVNEGDEKTYFQRLSTALKKAAGDFPRNARVRATFPSSKVVIKELTVPFLDAEKIRMVVEYEIESSIPFPLDKALIDFIIVEQSEVQQSSTILVAAAQFEDVKKYVDSFKKADIELQSLTIDTFALADLVTQIPVHKTTKHTTALVDISDESVRVAVVDQNSLIATRTITKGLGELTEKTTARARKKIVTDLLDEISFTLNSFALKDADIIIKKILYRGDRDFSEEFSSFCTDSLQLTCEYIAVDKIASVSGIISKVTIPENDWPLYAAALGASLASPTFEDFSLRQKEASLPAVPRIKRHIFTAGTICFLLFSMLGIQGYLEVKSLQNRLVTKEKQAIEALRAILPKDNRARKRSSLTALLKATDAFVQEQEEIWAPFARERLMPNTILLELATLFNRKKYNVTIEEVIISGEEQEAHPVEVTGLFRSQGDGNDHFAQFGALEEEIKASSSLVLTEEIDPTLEDDGIRFVVRLKQSEE